jgi:hypothetical protein
VIFKTGPSTEFRGLSKKSVDFLNLATTALCTMHVCCTFRSVVVSLVIDIAINHLFFQTPIQCNGLYRQLSGFYHRIVRNLRL